MIVSDMKVGQSGIVTEVRGDEKINKFLFTLGCFEGERLTLVSKLSGSYIINIKDGRYAVDKKMASSIDVELIDK